MVQATISAVLPPIAPTIDGTPSIVGSIEEGQTITFQAAPVAGNPTPTVTFQVYVDDSLQASGGTDLSFQVPLVADDETPLRVVQIATNANGTAEASSPEFNIIDTNTGPTDPPPATGTLVYSVQAHDGPDGDALTLTPTQLATPGDDWRPAYLEWRIDDGAGGFITGRTINATLGHTTHFKGRSGVANAVEVRQVDKRLRILYMPKFDIPSGDVAALVGQTVTHENGATATITGVSNGSGIINTYCEIDGITGVFAAEGDLFVNAVKIGRMIKTDAAPRLVPLPSEIRENPWQAAVTVTPAVGTPTVTITTEDGRTTFTEGEIIGLKAEAFGFQSTTQGRNPWPREELCFRWSVLTAGNTANHPALPADWPWSREHSEGEGDLWAFRPLTAGTVQIQCTVWHPDDYAGRQSVTLNATITPKTTAFTAANTFVVDPDGTGTGGPATTNPIYTTLDAAVTAIRTTPSATTRRLSIKRGTTHTPASLEFFQDGFDLLCLDAYGTGAKPIINMASGSGSLRFRGNTAAIVEGLDLRGYYDPSIPDDMVDLGDDGIEVQDCAYFSMYDCKVGGFRTNVTAGGIGTATLMSGCDLGSYSEFGFWGVDSGSQYIVGCRNMQDPQAWRSKNKFDSMAPFTANHGAMRSSRNYGVRCMENSDVGCWTGWSSNNSVQSINRFFGQMPDVLLPLSIHRWRVTGAEMAIGPTTSRAIATPADAVIHKVYHSIMNSPASVIKINCTGVSFRNYVAVMEDCVDEFDNGFQTMISRNKLGNGDPSMFEAEYAPRIVDCVTLINLKTTPNQNGRLWVPVTTDTNTTGPNVLYDELSNIFEHAPNWPNAVSNLPLDTAGQWTPIYLGWYKYGYSVLNVISANNATRPSNESNVLVTGLTSGATGRVKYADRYDGDGGAADANWATGTGRGLLHLNAATTGTFQVGETVTLSSGGTAEVAAFTLGTYDNGGPAPNTAHTALSTASWRPLAGNPQIGNLDAGVVLPYDDVFGNVRRRDGTGARGAVESL